MCSAAKTVAIFALLWYNRAMEKNDITTSNTAETVALSRAEYDALKKELAQLQAQNQWLMEQLKLNKKKLFGQSSEKIKEGLMEQLSLNFNEAERLDEAYYEADTKVKAHSRKRRGQSSINEAVTKDLPVEVVDHSLTDEERKCPVCGTEMVEIGTEVKRTLVITPPKFSIREDVYHTYACKECEKESDEAVIVKTPREPEVFPGSFASPEAISTVMTQKFEVYSPLYRLEQEFERAGIRLSRQTMSNWILHASDDWLKPIYDELHRELVKRDVLHADETTLQVLREADRSSASKSYMWLYRTSGDAEQAIVLYDYKPNRKPENAKAFLDGFSGWLHADGYQGYHTLPENIRIVGCMAHARRKFDEAMNVLSKEAQPGSEAAKGVAYCSKLFKIEENISGKEPEEKIKMRREQAQPVLDAMLAWANDLVKKTAPKSHLGRALNYLIEQWPYLIRYLEDGRLEISNNRAERSIKPFVMGRNYALSRIMLWGAV